ncbi:MAG: hypothetical protein FWG87_10840 [Defluviitaleaceae bacterium]|nr:hypothetical protein [Defluviitaleaceae bacterium]
MRLPFVRLSWRLVVGDGFIRPEVGTFVNSGWVTCINAELGNLGTDKSVPYESVRILPFVCLPFVRLSWRLIVGDGFIRPEVGTFVNSGWVACINV